MNRHLRRKQKKEGNKKNNINIKLLEGIQFHSNKNFNQAEKIYKHLNQLSPNNYDVLRHLGILNQDLGRLEKAYNFFQDAIRVKSDGFEALNNLGTIHILNKNQNLALKCFEKSISINPNYVPTINNLAGLYHRLNNGDASLKYSKKALSLQPKNPLALNQHAKALVLNDKIEEGIEIFQKICDANPDRSDFKANLATALKEMGEFEKSKKIIDLGFKENFKILDFFAPFACDKTNSLTEEHIQYYKDQLKNNEISNEDKILISHTFFEYYRNKKDFDESGEFLKMSNELQYSLRAFDTNLEENLFKKMKTIFKNISFEPIKNKNDVVPIFICGMPRSGTTLCEQILSTHSKVSGAGELSELIKISGLENIIQTDKDLLESFETNIKNKKYLQSVREQYLKYLQKFIKSKESHVTDKLPHNFILIGLIKLIIPEAKIIYCKRSPMDNCFSLYSHKFVDMAHQYSYNQQMLGKYYLMHEDLMSFWLNKYNDIFVLDNEELVADQEGISKKIIKFCNLDWEKECLNFHKTKRQVRTASIEQVRQPINNKSIGAWKNYKEYLSVLITSLEKK